MSETNDQTALPSNLWRVESLLLGILLTASACNVQDADRDTGDSTKPNIASISQPIDVDPIVDSPGDAVTAGDEVAHVASESSGDLLDLDLTKDILDPAKQKYIWDSEHITFEIEKRFGKHFKAALRDRNKPQLSTYFRSDFDGHVIDKVKSESNTRKLTKGLVTELRHDAVPGVTRGVDSDGLIDDLLTSLAGFETIEKLGLRVLKIDRMRTAEATTRWTTQILIYAFGKDASAGLLAMDSLQRVEFEYQEKSELDGGQVVSSWKVESHRLRSCPRMLMEEVTDQFGLSKLPLVDNWQTDEMAQQFRFQMAAEDFDRDGYLDLAIATVSGEPYLLRSIRGERFEDVTDSFNLARWNPLAYRYLATWVDYDNDNYPDLIMGSRLYRNVGGKSFEDVTDASGLRFNQRPMGCAVADYDGDGLLDVYVLYQFSSEQKRSGPIPWVGDDRSGQPNQLWHNEGNGRFRNVTQDAGAAGGLRNSFAAAWLFADQDHLPDLYVANDFGTNVLLRNRGDGSFEDISGPTGVADYATSMGVAAGDVDNDGWTELYVANMFSKMGRRIIAHVNEDDYDPGIYQQIKGACAGNRLYSRTPDDTCYEDHSTSLGVNGIGWAFAPAMVDLDNDGLLDMYATTGFMSFDREKPDG